MLNNPVESTDLENKNLSKEPSNELLSILQEFKTSMVKPSEIFGRFVEKAREENFTDDEINILLTLKELKKIIPKGSIDYYKKKYNVQSTNLFKSQLTKLQNNDTEQKEDAELPPHQEQIQELEPIKPRDLGELSINKDNWRPPPIQKENEEFKKFREEKAINEDLFIPPNRFTKLVIDLMKVKVAAKETGAYISKDLEVRV